jgi:hypothetical protein
MGQIGCPLSPLLSTPYAAMMSSARASARRERSDSGIDRSRPVASYPARAPVLPSGGPQRLAASATERTMLPSGLPAVLWPNWQLAKLAKRR